MGGCAPADQHQTGPHYHPRHFFRTSCDDQHIARLMAPVRSPVTSARVSPLVSNTGVTMSSPRHISLLIGEIYDAILDRAQWIEALDKAAQFVGAQAGALIWRNPVCRAVNVIHAFGLKPGYVEL